nr:MFS transporter [Scytonema sp. UIC 10036]
MLQPSSYQVWAQASARFLYQAGYGTIQFFIPLIFVNQLNFSATVVGIAIGCGALAGVVGHFLGGYLADSPYYGRKRTLLFSALLSILAAIALTFLPNLSMLIVTNLLMGLSAGCYWTAADAAVIDVTPPKEHQKAFAILVLADSLGSGLGILSGGIILSSVTQPQTLFLIAGLVLVVFLVTVLVAIADSHQEANEHSDPLQGFSLALKDSSLQVFMLVNVLFTTYIALVSTTLPLYFTNFVLTEISQTTSDAGSSLLSVTNLFTWCYVGIGSVLQLPLVQMLNSLLNVRVLSISMLLWVAGFVLVSATHLMPSIILAGTIASFSVLSIASTIYKPFAPALIAELAPKSLRAVYLAIGYQCWSIGYFVGPIVGGWAMDRSPAIAHGLWIATAISCFVGLFMLHILRLKKFAPVG